MLTGQEGGPRPAALPASPFSAPVRAFIEDCTARLDGGFLEVWQLPDPLAGLAWAVLAQVASQDELQERLARAEADADRLYRLAFGSNARARLVDGLIEQSRVRDHRKRRTAA